MKITVTQDDIDNGEPRTASKCAIARAARRCFPLALQVYVADFLTLDGRTATGFERRRLPLPRNAHDFTYKYDHLLPVEPFSFWVDAGEGAEPFVAPGATKPVPAAT